MKTLKENTKKALKFLENYRKSNCFSIIQAYKTPSQAKREIELKLKIQMHDTGGYDYRIISYSKFQFTCAWQTNKGYLHIETPTETYETYYYPF